MPACTFTGSKTPGNGHLDYAMLIYRARRERGTGPVGPSVPHRDLGHGATSRRRSGQSIEEDDCGWPWHGIRVATAGLSGGGYGAYLHLNAGKWDTAGGLWCSVGHLPG